MKYKDYIFQLLSRQSKTQIMQVVESFGEDNEISLKVDEKWQPIVEDILSSK